MIVGVFVILRKCTQKLFGSNKCNTAPQSQLRGKCDLKVSKEKRNGGGNLKWKMEIHEMFFKNLIDGQLIKNRLVIHR